MTHPARRATIRMLRTLGSTMLPHANSRTRCPPGTPDLSPSAIPPIVVATVPRSGTHVMMDLLSNTWPELRRSPLYIDLDRLWEADRSLDLAIHSPGYVMMTHHPAASGGGDDFAAALDRLLERAVVVVVERDLAAVQRSITISSTPLGTAEEPLELAQAVDRFRTYWRDRPRIVADFAQLVDPDEMLEPLTAVAAAAGLQDPVRAGAVPPPTRTRTVLLAKAVTRLIGRRAPTVNTTVGFRVGS